MFDYSKGRSKAYGVFDYTYLNHRIEEAVWNVDKGRWEVGVMDLESGRTSVDEAEVILNGTGFLKCVHLYSQFTPSG